MIYQDISNKEYCAHTDYDWNEEDPPNLGYIDPSKSRDELVSILADRYLYFFKFCKIQMFFNM